MSTNLNLIQESLEKQLQKQHQQFEAKLLQQSERLETKLKEQSEQFQETVGHLSECQKVCTLYEENVDTL